MNKIILIVCLLFGVTVSAQQEERIDISGVRKNKKIIRINFKDDLVKGRQEAPEGSFFQTKKDFNYKKIIKIRENFIPEVESSGLGLGSK